MGVKIADYQFPHRSLTAVKPEHNKVGPFGCIYFRQNIGPFAFVYRDINDLDLGLGKIAHNNFTAQGNVVRLRGHKINLEVLVGVQFLIPANKDADILKIRIDALYFPKQDDGLANLVLPQIRGSKPVFQLNKNFRLDVFMPKANFKILYGSFCLMLIHVDRTGKKTGIGAHNRIRPKVGKYL